MTLAAARVPSESSTTRTTGRLPRAVSVRCEAMPRDLHAILEVTKYCRGWPFTATIVPTGKVHFVPDGCIEPRWSGPLVSLADETDSMRSRPRLGCAAAQLLSGSRRRELRVR